MDWKLEVVPIPISDVDLAKAFYSEQVGFVVDLDTEIGDEMRLVQLTPPGSDCSIHLSTGILNVPPGVLEGLQLVVSDIEAARAELVERGVETSPVQHVDEGVWVEGRGGEWNSFVFFSDPDGNGWVLQERPARPPFGRLASVKRWMRCEHDSCVGQKGEEMNDDPRGNYAPVNGLEMYYEIHGTGEPLVVLHGAYMTIETMGEIVPSLATTRQVIAVELQAHGHTADIDRPLTYEQMADDVAALLDEIGIEKADLFGFSMGGGVALQVAIRHPEAVRKLIVASASYTSEGAYPELFDMIPSITPDAFAGSPLEEAYLRTAPNPEDFPNLVAKLKRLDMEPFTWPPEDIQGIDAPTLLIIGDSDAIRPEHALEMFRLLGGGVMGDLAGLPNSRLAVLPGTTHFIPPGFGILDRSDWLVAMIGEFLDSPMPEIQPGEDG